ncbi:efflux RND transporter periplasmic adaptor subunit [Sphingoaurantiacus capsulatus]|uniref:Efflux RND transporter periplasmic adaptor subunit n=1 Tax=Sphingoaurantiacus capsulatus TaxID=1771310 RepID=A0ABV7XBG1_9SPHN
MIFRPRSALPVLALLALAACGDGDAAKAPGGPGGGQAPSVTTATVQPIAFSDRIEAVGTAYARESTTIAATVTERIVRLNFTDGAYVQRGQIIAELSRGEQAAGLNEAQARLTEAQQQLTRLRQLQDRGFATNARVDEQVAMVNAARAQAGQAQAQIGDRVIRAPFSGVVGLRRISAGATVSPGTEIATISDLSQIKLDFALPETFLSAMRTGQAIEARAAAFQNEVFRGAVESIEPTVDPVTRSVTVRAVLPNPDARIKPGMLLTVNVLANPRTTLAVPELALVAERDRSFVFKVDDESTALKTPVEVGIRQQGMVEVKRGLAAGDRIVAEGTIKVRDGGKVRTAPAAGTAAAARGAAE